MFMKQYRCRPSFLHKTCNNSIRGLIGAILLLFVIDICDYDLNLLVDVEGYLAWDSLVQSDVQGW